MRYFASSSLIQSNDAISNEFMKLTANPAQGKGGTCFGDSGGTRTVLAWMRKRNKRGVIFTFILLVLVIGAASGWLYTHPQVMTTTVIVTTTVRVATTVTTTLQPMGMSDFTLPIVDSKGLTGQTLTLSSLRGKVIVLEFMEPWCPHCQNMAPIMEALHKQYADKNVVFLEVAGPWRGANPQNVAQYITQFKSNLTYVYDSGDVFTKYAVTGTPTFFILTENGVIAATYVGETTNETLATTISQQLT